ncbi:hypothetical protein ACLOJK_016513 [Asimina triloba]
METNTSSTTIHSKQGDDQKQGPSSSDHESPTTNTSPPPSSSSSPSHDFSFTFSLQPTSQTTPPTPTSVRGMFNTTNKAHHPPSIAIDLSPADEIFFHGHLLPLRLFSHTSTSPRTSTTSLDNLSLPIRDFMEDTHKKPTSESNAGGAKTGPKNSNSFSLFSLAKWRKVFDVGNRKDIKKKVSLDVGRALKRYARAFRPILFFRGGEKEKQEVRQQQYSFSGNLNSRWRREWGGRRGGEFSAPASMRTSPTNSGLLLATAAAPSNDSTMEELQSAIQAAIAHCKNSIAAKDQEIRKC